MKKKILAIFSLVIPLLSGCDNSSTSLRVTFGRLYDSSYSGNVSNLYLYTTNISYDDLNRKITNKESFVLCVYEYKTLLEGGEIECTCYTSFASSLNKYMKKNNAEIYAIDPSDFSSNDRFSLSIALGDQTLAIFSNGLLLKQENSSNDGLSSLEKVESFLDSSISWSNILYVSKEQLDSLLKEKGRYTVGYLRKTCSDCAYLNYNFLKEYSKKELNTPLYVIECDVPGIRYDSLNKLDKEQWQSFKDEYGLSSKYDLSFGYDEGYVPTFLTYTNNGQSYAHYGELVSDGAVYMNDTLSLENGVYKVAGSYWDGRNHPFFESLSADVKTSLIGLEIHDGQYSDYGDDGVYWNKEYSSKYHDPLLEGFLDYYTK